MPTKKYKLHTVAKKNSVVFNLTCDSSRFWDALSEYVSHFYTAHQDSEQFAFLQMMLTHCEIQFTQPFNNNNRAVLISLEHSSVLINSDTFKLYFSGLSAMFSSYIVTLQTPTVVGHHIDIPATLVPTLHFANVLMKPFTLFLTE